MKLIYDADLDMVIDTSFDQDDAYRPAYASADDDDVILPWMADSNGQDASQSQNEFEAEMQWLAPLGA